VSGGGAEHAVFRLAEIPEEGAREFFIGEGDWPYRGFVVRRGREVVAYENICPHKNHPLNLAEDDFLVTVAGQGRLLRCASHGALFVPENGLCVFGPCAGRSLKRLECRVEDGIVRVTV
jgi:nitrite reductase/ring-hydroxylating ferredoxin subunit